VVVVPVVVVVTEIYQEAKPADQVYQLTLLENLYITAVAVVVVDLPE
jgi:hypothetical protein